MSHKRQKNRRPLGGSPPAAKPLARKKIWLFRLALLAFPFLLLALLETGLRLGNYGFDPHFFKHQKISAEDYFVQNDDFSYRFFPKNTARFPGALRMRAVKPPQTCRIFIFGESAAMGDPEPAYGPARYLEMLLQAKFPETKFEVVNTAFTAINSHVIRPIARECARHDGDLWIVYMGNNEMVGPYGAATVFGQRSAPLPYVRLLTAVQATRVGQLCVSLARKLHHRDETFSSWGGMEMFLHNEIPPGSPLTTNVYRNFQANLDDIVRAGLRSGARVLLNTVAVNLRDCPPFASSPARELTAGAQAEFDQAYTNGLAAEARGQFAEAIQFYEQAAQREEHFADLQYHWGKCLLRQTNTAAAREHLRQARDDDALPFRCDSKLNGLIRTEAQKYRGSNLVFFDAAGALASSNADDLCGDETFYEHVHFNFSGAYRLGLAWAQLVEKMLPPQPAIRPDWLTEAACDQQLGLSDWNRVAIWKSMITRLRVPPFAGQAGNAARIAGLETQIERRQTGLNTNAAAMERRNFLAQIAARPDDFELRANYALFLQATDDLPGAVAEWQQVRASIPQDYVALFQLGHVLNLMGRWPEAEQNLRAALVIRPNFPEGWAELGGAQASQQKFADARVSYTKARQQQPQNAETLFRLGLVQAQLHDTTAARECLREAARLAPNNWEIHFELGGLLDAAGRLDAALTEFAEAARLNPGSAQAHFNHGVLLAKREQFAAAREEFRAALRLNPGYVNARQALDQVQMLLRQKQ